MPNTFETLSDAQLANAIGGMQWDGFRRSTNVEDFRSPAGVAADNAYQQRINAGGTGQGAQPSLGGLGVP
jgi:hypothetical protein